MTSPLDTDASAENTLTRRELFTGVARVAAIAGTAAVVGGGAASLVGCNKDDSAPSVDVLTVSPDDVVTLDAFNEIENPKKYYSLHTLADLDAGSLLWASGSKIASVLATGQTSSPLSTIALLSLSTGRLSTVLPKAEGHDEGYSLYDVRCSDSIIVWTESNYLTAAWRVYIAKLPGSGTSIGQAVKLDEGDAQYDVPIIAAVGDRAYWIVQPDDEGERKGEDSILKAASSEGGTPANILTSAGRFNGGLVVSGDTVTCMPRANVSGIYYALTAVQGSSGAIVSTQTMPRSFKPGTAVFMNGSFAFTIEAGYDYGGGIGSVGTYIPLADKKWLRLIRQPITAPGMCNGWIFSKSGSRTAFVDTVDKRYFTLEAPDSSEDYGDYSIGAGEVEKLVNYATVTKEKDGKTSSKVVVREIVPKVIS